jgi:polysaccharide export outer membrane protein
VVVADSLPAPGQDRSRLDFSNYRIGPSDEIVVKVLGADELEREGTVDAAGNFSMPLVGSVAAGGKTPAELSQDIAGKLAGRYLKNPQVSVNVKKAVSQTFTVDGAVTAPGVYPITGRLTLQQAIATAKGANEFANINNVVIFRTVNDRRMAALFNLKDVRSGRLADPDIYGNDIVVVGENATKRFFKDVTGAFPVLGAFIPVL